jgi:ParB family chromosome partitioning protein
VREEGPGELVEAVERGELAVSLAAEVSKLPTEEQEQVVLSDDIREAAREAVRRAHVANNSGNNEWYTPASFIESARSVMGGIDCDPATSEVANRTVKAETYYTKDDDGLSQPWAGRVWMNPPYAQPLIDKFSAALVQKYSDGELDEACVLVNNATETGWFQRLAGSASAVCFPRSRVRFLDPEGKPSGAPLQGQAVIYFGKNADAFRAEFAGKGTVLLRA